MRTQQEINNDYAFICGKLGEAIFQLNKVLPDRIKGLTEKIEILVQEAADVSAKEKADGSEAAK